MLKAVKNSLKGRWSHVLLVLLVILCLGWTFRVSYPLLSSRYNVVDDARKVIYWMHEYRDPELFKDDYLTEIAKKGVFSPGFNFLFRLASFFIDPVFFGKLLVFPLVILGMIYFFRLGKAVNNEGAGLLLSTLFFLTHFRYISQGLQKSFAFPFLSMFLFYLIKKKFWKMSIVLVLQGLFYPPIFILSSVVYAISAIIEVGFSKGLKRIFLKNGNIQFLIAFLLVLGIFLSLSLNNRIELLITKPYTILSISKLKQMPEFGMRGRFRVFYPPPPGATFGIPNYLLGNRPLGMTLIGLPVERGWLFLISLFIVLVCRRAAFNLRKEIWVTLLAGFLIYGVAFLLMFLLYIPQRYIFYALSLFLLVFVSVNFTRSIEIILSFLGKRLPILRLDAVRHTVYITSVIALCVWAFAYVRTHGGLTVPSIRYGESKKVLYDFVSTLPKDVLIAGSPARPRDTMKNIPILSKRKVFLNAEFVGLTEEMKTRTFDFYRAYYSNSYEEILDFCREYKITHLLVNLDHFPIPEKGVKAKLPKSSPYREFVERIIRVESSFALKNVPDRGKIFNQDSVYIIQVRDLAMLQQGISPR